MSEGNGSKPVPVPDLPEKQETTVPEEFRVVLTVIVVARDSPIITAGGFARHSCIITEGRIRTPQEMGHALQLVSETAQDHARVLRQTLFGKGGHDG